MKIKLLGLKAAFILSAVTLISCGESHNNEVKNTESENMEETVKTETTTSNINTEESTVTWKGSMLGLYSHEGTVNISEASVETAGDKVVGGSFTVDMNSITPTDENYDIENESTPEKLVGHLQSPDFFDVATYSTASFVITGSEGSTVKGNLTIRGITNEEVIEDVSYDDASKTWSGKMTFDRKKYEVAFDMPVKDKVLSDDIELSFNLSL